MKAFVLCAALAAAPVFAEQLVARQGDDSVRLADSPCKSEQVLGRLEPKTHEEYKAATAVFQGQNFVACWRVMGGVAHLVYEDGDQGIIPMAELKRELVS
jgi:hypothetical protein